MPCPFYPEPFTFYKLSLELLEWLAFAEFLVSVTSEWRFHSFPCYNWLWLKSKHGHARPKTSTFLPGGHVTAGSFAGYTILLGCVAFVVGFSRFCSAVSQLQVKTCRIGREWLCLFCGWVFSRYFLILQLFQFQVYVWLGIFWLFCAINISEKIVIMFQKNLTHSILQHPTTSHAFQPARHPYLWCDFWFEVSVHQLSWFQETSQQAKSAFSI